MCCIIQGTAVDDAVVAAFFQAIRPAALDALQQVLAAQQADHRRLEQHWQDQLRRVRYEAHLAERQYHAVDPDNRLVASTLERRWEEKLDQLQQTQEANEKFVRSCESASLPPNLCEQFRRISETLPGLWANNQISPAQKKALLRAIIAKVILKRVLPDRVEIKIVWVSGHYSITQAQLSVRRETDMTGYAAMVKRVDELFKQGLDDHHIADALTHEGFHSARKPIVSTSKVYKIRLENRWLCVAETHRNANKIDGRWTTRGLAAELGTDTRWLIKQIYRQTIAPDRVHRHPVSGVYLIDDDPKLLDSLRRALKA